MESKMKNVIVKMTVEETCQKIAEHIADHFLSNESGQWYLCLYADGSVGRSHNTHGMSDVALIIWDSCDGPESLGIDSHLYNTEEYWTDDEINWLAESFCENRWLQQSINDHNYSCASVEEIAVFFR